MPNITDAKWSSLILQLPVEKVFSQEPWFFAAVKKAKNNEKGQLAVMKSLQITCETTAFQPFGDAGTYLCP